MNADQADELAASFRPAWDVEEPGDSTIANADIPTTVAQAPTKTDAAPAAAIVGTPVISIGAASPAPAPAPAAAAPAQALKSMPTQLGNPTLDNGAKAAAAAYTAGPARAPIESSEPLDADQVIEVAPARTKALGADAPTLPVGNKTPSVPPRAPPASRKPATASAKVAADPFRAAPVAIASPETSDDFPVVKKSRGWIYVAVGIGIALGVGGVVKFALTDDTPTKAKTAETVTAGPPPATTNEIPPPPPKDEVTTPSTAAAAETTTAPAPAPSPSPAAKEPEPPPAREPVAVKAAPAPPPRPPVVAAPRARPLPPPAPASPKTPPKSAGGGIVRDTPF